MWIGRLELWIVVIQSWVGPRRDVWIELIGCYLLRTLRGVEVGLGGERDRLL